MERYRWARGYRQGRLVAGRVEITIERNDDRLGLSPRERRRIVAGPPSRRTALLCQLQPTQQRRGELQEIEFDLRELERSP